MTDKEYRAAVAKNWRGNNKEKEREYRARYYQKHKEKINAVSKAYYYANKEKIAAYYRAKREAGWNLCNALCSELYATAKELRNFAKGGEATSRVLVYLDSKEYFCKSDCKTDDPTEEACRECARERLKTNFGRNDL